MATTTKIKTLKKNYTDEEFRNHIKAAEKTGFISSEKFWDLVEKDFEKWQKEKKGKK